MCDKEDKKGKDLFRKIAQTENCEELENFTKIHSDERDKIILCNKINLAFIIVIGICTILNFIIYNIFNFDNSDILWLIFNEIIPIILMFITFLYIIIYIILFIHVYYKIFNMDKLKFYADIKKHKQLCRDTGNILIIPWGTMIVCGGLYGINSGFD